MNMILKVLSVMNQGEGYYLGQIKKAIQDQQPEKMTKSQHSNIRNCIYKLWELGMVHKERIGNVFLYTLVKDKLEYKPNSAVGYLKKIVEPKPPKPKKVINPDRMIKNEAVSWFAGSKVYLIEQLLHKEFGFNDYRKATEPQIIELYQKHSTFYAATK